MDTTPNKYGFHVNPKTLAPGICNASTKPCLFGGESGHEYHYASMPEAIKASEDMIAQRAERLKLMKNKPLDESIDTHISNEMDKPYSEGVLSQDEINSRAEQKLREGIASYREEHPKKKKRFGFYL